MSQTRVEIMFTAGLKIMMKFQCFLSLAVDAAESDYPIKLKYLEAASYLRSLAT